MLFILCPRPRRMSGNHLFSPNSLTPTKSGVKRHFASVHVLPISCGIKGRTIRRRSCVSAPEPNVIKRRCWRSLQERVDGFLGFLVHGVVGRSRRLRRSTTRRRRSHDVRDRLRTRCYRIWPKSAEVVRRTVQEPLARDSDSSEAP